MAKLGDICFQITDGSHNPPAGIENSKHLMLSSKNINDDEITTTAPRFLTDEQFDIENKRTNVLSGDLLMTIVGTSSGCSRNVSRYLSATECCGYKAKPNNNKQSIFNVPASEYAKIFGV